MLAVVVTSLPTLTVVAPLYVFAPLRVSAPLPSFVRPPTPLMGATIVPAKVWQSIVPPALLLVTLTPAPIQVPWAAVSFKVPPLKLKNAEFAKVLAEMVRVVVRVPKAFKLMVPDPVPPEIAPSLKVPVVVPKLNSPGVPEVPPTLITPVPEFCPPL